ncbi:MAG: class I SAM-dependent methyltransferase [Desulfobacteraceae bacterium]|nr:MAG: class I SAM-dependent methyltransferase [Desulfobacteraceae bacterium]
MRSSENKLLSEHLRLQDDVNNLAAVIDEHAAYYYGSYLFPRNVEGLRILDVGGADGTLALYLMRSRGAKVDILDEYEGHGSPALNYEKALERFGQCCFSDTKIIRGDVRLAKFRPKSYDAIYLRNSLHHIFPRGASEDNDVIQLFKKFHHWLSPGGYLILGECSWIMACRLLPPLRRLLFPNMHYPSKSSHRRWRDCAVKAEFGFSALRWYVPFKLRKLRPALSNEFCVSFLTGTYVLEMRKAG